MPYVEGESLRNRLAREPQLPLADAVRITRAVADALGYAQRQGIIHRDVKPENILLQGERCVLADFGVARAVDAAGERLTETGFALGTPAYMSPEQAAADRHLDPRSDIYSLGCVVYEMLAGEPPFTGRTAQALIARRLADPVPDLCTVRDVPRQVERAVRQALARAPADRFADAPAFARALEAAAGDTRTSTRPFGRRVLLAALGGLLIAAALVGLYSGLRPEPERARDPNLLAVAPFDVLAPSLELWREGLGDMLSRSLDGAGPLRTVSQTVALRRWEGRADRASAEALGRRTGAGLVVFGAVVPKGPDSVTLRAAVLDGGQSTEQAEIEVSGKAARIGELADSLGIRILQSLSRSRPIGSVRQVSLGSKSLPALRAFLQGERFYRRGLWDSALTRYDQAVNADSNFALALRRMATVLSWNPASSGAYRPGDEYAQRATSLNHGLSPKDSLLILADSFFFAAKNASNAREKVKLRFQSVATTEEAVRRYPGDAEVWYELGEARSHEPFPLRGAPAKTLATFERAIALDSGFAPAYEHLSTLALQLDRTDLARRYATAYIRSDPTSQLLNLGAQETRLLALMLDSSRSSAVNAARMMDTASVFLIFRMGLEYLALWPDSGESAVRLLRRIGEPHRPAGANVPWVLDTLMWPQYLAAALAFRGHLHEAYEIDRLLLLDPDASMFSGFLDPFLDLSLLGVIPDSIARAAFAGALKPAAPWGGALDYFTPRHLRGLPWWLAGRDTTSLARFAARAADVSRRRNAPWIALRSRLLGTTANAYLSLARGDSAEALRRMEAIPDTLCLADDLAPNCFHLRLTQTRLLVARGDYRRAADLLEFWRWDDSGNSPSFVLATLERGRIAERLGEREKAIESYQFIMAVWRRADPELQPFVTEAREALARLED